MEHLITILTDHGDGVVIGASAFGTGSVWGSVVPDSLYSLGRTVTHALGHYLLLNHIWGGGCIQDDEVADTPDAQSPYFGCPNLVVSSCGSTDIHLIYILMNVCKCFLLFREEEWKIMQVVSNSL